MSYGRSTFTRRGACLCTAETLERRVVLSDVVGVGPEFRLNSSTGLVPRSPQAAMEADGSFVVVWERQGDGGGYGVYARRFDPAGMPRGDEFRVNTFTQGQQRSPAIAIDADGDFVVTWESFFQDGSAYGIYAQRYDAAGVAQGLEFRVNTYTTWDQRLPAVGMDDGGNFVVAWHTRRAGASSADIYAQRYDATGARRGDEFQVNSVTAFEQRFASVAMDADGDFVVAWEGADGSEQGIVAQRFDAAGAPRGTEFQVNTFTNTGERDPAAAMDGAGNFVITWRSEDQDPGRTQGIYAQRFESTGVRSGNEFRVNTYTPNNQLLPAVAMARTGSFVIAWHSNGQDGSAFGVYAQRYDPNGAPRGAEFRANTFTTNDQQNAAVAMNFDGDFVIVWQSAFQDGTSSSIYGQRYAVVPEVTSSSFLFESSPHRLRFRFNHDVRDSLGTDDLIVQNLTTGQTIPSEQFALVYDSLSEVATFIYVGPGDGAIAGVLTDGRYRATLRAEGIITPQGASPAADHVFEFFFVNGDANRDGVVNLRDFNILAHHFGQTGTDFARGDFTYDGATDLDDFNLLTSRFGVGLPAAAQGVSANDQLDEEDDWSGLVR